jgi:hypothetical protein
MKHFLVIILSVLLTYKAQAQTIFARDAGKHIGEVLKVQGRLYSCEVITDTVNPKNRVELLYVGGTIKSNHYLTVIIRSTIGYQNYIDKLNSANHTQRETIVSAVGKVFLYKGKPAIELPNLKELGFLDFKDNAKPSPMLQ